jgi:ribonuclease Z
MAANFHPRLINPPIDDPGLFVPFCHEKRAILFDLGDLNSLPARDLLKVTHVFVSHTHMDHFIGCDHLLRLMLGREKVLNLFGPAGFLAHLEGKLAGYTWNLVENYENRLVLRATEVHPGYLFSRTYSCADRFKPRGDPSTYPFSTTLHEEPSFSVSASVLDHGIPCLGFSLQERFHVNIKKTGLAAMGLETGPWLNDFKRALFEERPEDARFEIPSTAASGGKKGLPLGVLAEKIAVITPGQKISYITDVLFSRENIAKIVQLADGSDHLFIEAAFSDLEKAMARQKCHLTAGQAGEIAGLAGAKRYTLFHFSPRYLEQEAGLIQEAAAGYGRAAGRQHRSS